MVDYIAEALRAVQNPRKPEPSGLPIPSSFDMSQALAGALGPQTGSGIFGNMPPQAMIGLDPNQVLQVANQRGEAEYRNMLTAAGVLDFSKKISGQEAVEKAQTQEEFAKNRGAEAEHLANVHGYYQLAAQQMHNQVQKDLHGDALKFDRVKAESAVRIRDYSDYRQKIKDNPALEKTMKAPAKPTKADYMTTGYFKEMIETINAYQQMATAEEAQIKALGEGDAAKIGAFSKTHAAGLRKVAGMYADELGITVDEASGKSAEVPPADWAKRFIKRNPGATEADATTFWKTNKSGGK